METDPLTQAIIGAAIQVHNELGPGLLESTYETCLAYELGSAVDSKLCAKFNFPFST